MKIFFKKYIDCIVVTAAFILNMHSIRESIYSAFRMMYSTASRRLQPAHGIIS